jgi:hypothetical protein
MTSSIAAPQGLGSISLTAKIPSTVNLSRNVVPIRLDLGSGDSTEVSLPLEMQWNVDRLATEILIVASFPNSARALTGRSGHSVPASTLDIEIGDSGWKRFPAHRTQLASSGVLLGTLVLSEYSRQHRQAFRMRIRCSENAISPGEYNGQMDLQAIVR